MSLVGNLEDLSLPDILQIVSLSKKSGILQLEREGRQGKIIIRQGRVIQTVSPRQGRTLGEILAARGIVRPGDLHQALEEQRAGGNSELLGSILVRKGLIEEATLEKVVQEQIEDAIVFFLSWKDGTFSFELVDIKGRGEFSVDPQAFILERGIDTQWLVLEGTRVMDERSRERGGAAVAEADGPPPAESAETSFADLGSAPRARPLVLADDDDAFRESAAEAFGRRGFRVVGCPGVAQALRAIEEESRGGEPPPVVADIVMPTSDSRGFLGGLELLERLRERHPGSAAAAVTAYPDETVRAKVEQLGFRFLVKPAAARGAAGAEAFFDEVAAVFGASAPAREVADAAPAPAPAAGAAAPAPAPEPNERERLLAALAEVHVALARASREAAAAGLGGQEGALLRDMIEELQSPRAASEIGLLILRFAAELLNRAVLFVVKGDRAVGLGGFGVDVAGSGEPRGVRGVTVPLEDPSILAAAVRGRAPVRGPVADTPSNRALFGQLGGAAPTEAVALPLVSGGRVRVVLYGDNLPEAKPLPGTRALELFLAQAGLTLEKVLLERKLEEMEGDPAAGELGSVQRVGGGER